MKIYKNKFTNALISENDYKYLSDSQKSQIIEELENQPFIKEYYNEKLNQIELNN